MMIYKKSCSKNNRKSKSNLKRQRHKSLNKNTLKKDHKKTNKVSTSPILASKPLSARYILVILFVTAIALIAIYYKSILIYGEQVYHTDLFNSDTLAIQETSIQELEDSKSDEQKYASTHTSIPFTRPFDAVLPVTENKTSKLAVTELEDIKQNKNTAEVKSDQKVDTENSLMGPDLKNYSDFVDHNKPKAELALQDEPKKIQGDIELPHEPLPIVLTSNDKVFFAGDSLMQGVAPYVKKMLFKQYKIESLDLSKQSTGLAYPSAFDWPKTINDNLIADPSIKLLVVFLGANDPWDFPVKGYVKYAKFKSELWEEHYRLRIESILNSAIEHDVQVLWLAAPCMRKPKLNNGMVYLNNLYESELEKVQQHFLTTNELLGCTYEKFSNFIETDKAKIKVRVDDGVHFTSIGQKILAKAIMEKIIYKELEDTHND
ncbi:SGNH/GDSL hydrolase family protein [Gilliamella sp. ESL0250]|uniref:SGNH/GDSL hydrolase family protein n=1 Tax=Gilliamella sp. ESL0250 TaxID=2705036 RepID=UPI0015808B1A|nr:SGNH/GDSL hydrolase family protein [Gilliamella sp. ESL0250]NUF49286.1 DUF459 domain-containing protein [Gilliamella sp. ESL0250]